MITHEQGTISFTETKKDNGPVECLGQTFENDEARREHYLALLAEKLKDPKFRETPGFPKGTDDAILLMSDPPYYTACPNPFLEEFVRIHGLPYNQDEPYSREPFAVDVRVGKTDQLYKVHGYHTKVPHLAIIPSILHYTKPGDLVLDGFCGSGMTGVAAQWCGTAPFQYKRYLEEQWQNEGHPPPEWGTRKVILGDLSPAASFIAANYNSPFDVKAFDEAAQELLSQVMDELGWMHRTVHDDGKSLGHINHIVWSEVFSCPECSADVVFSEVALDRTAKKVRSEFQCKKCGCLLTKRILEQQFEASFDGAIGRTIRTPKRMPVLINYSIGKMKFEKAPDAVDYSMLDRVAKLPRPTTVPAMRMMHAPESVAKWGDKWRAGTASFSHTHHLYFPRSAHTLANCWAKATAIADGRLRAALLFWLDSQLVNLSIQNRYRPHVSLPYNPLSGVYYISSLICEADPFRAYRNKAKRVQKAFSQWSNRKPAAIVNVSDCGTTAIPTQSIDYIFTDPPFGANFAYAELNFLVEAWHGVTTDLTLEAIESPHQGKSTLDYQGLMQNCFEEYYRVLKPGRWMTVVFSNNSNAVWRAIQEAIGTAGFVISDVRTMDKEQLSFNQVAGVTVKKDLMISAYKPTEALAHQFKLGTSTETAVWTFVDEHLSNVPVFVGSVGTADVIAERTPQVLLDRMIGFFVQRGVAVPISGPDFFAGLNQRYPQPRDGMFFKHGDQVAEYDRKRTTVQEMKQLTWLVSDEASATGWLRQQLHAKPQSYADIQPQFMQHSQSWAKHEVDVDLKEILALNFFRYDGKGPVPSQIHGYLSNGFREYRNLDKEDVRLKAKAKDRWYVPNPSKEGDLEKLRLRTLLKEFEEYRSSTARKIKQFRTEAVRAGFKHCYDQQDYQTIVTVAEKLPEKVIQEDMKLLMYYHYAEMVTE